MRKPWGGVWFQRLISLVVIVLALAIATRSCGPHRSPRPPARAIPNAARSARSAVVAPEPPRPIDLDCAGGADDDAWAAAARANQEGLASLPLTPFRRLEVGWRAYAPLVGREIGTRCDAGVPAFARRLAAWQTAHGLTASGVADEATFAALQALWMARRPFVIESRRGCPPAPPETSLAAVPPAQAYGGKALWLRPEALDAYERLAAAARAEVAETRRDPRLFSIVSGYRSPAEGAARCAAAGGCGGVTRASCSAHQSGLAIDFDLGAAPGFDPASADDANRLAITRGAPYRWMVDNAARFGFAPYPFEPWHWEWTGETD